MSYLKRGLAILRERSCDPVDAMEAAWRERYPEGTASQRAQDQEYRSALMDLNNLAVAADTRTFYGWWREQPEAALRAWKGAIR